MGGVLLWAQVDLRRRCASGVALVLLVGLVTAVVLTGVAGARRTSSSYERFLVASRVSHVDVFPGEVTPQQVHEFAKPHYIETVAALQTLQVQFPDGAFPNAAAPVDDHLGTLTERPRIVQGRAANPKDPNEIVLSEARAASEHLRVGATFELQSDSPAQVDALRSGASTSLPKPGGPELTMHLVGLSRYPSDLSLSGAEGGILVFTQAFDKRYASKIGSYSGDLLVVRLRHGAADIPRLVRRARAFFGSSKSFDVSPVGADTGGIQQSVDLLAFGAAIFAAIAAIAGLTATVLVLRRRIDTGATDHEVLRALGLTRAERALAVGISTIPTAVIGALLGVLGAWLASPIMPMGIARKAEPDPGLHFDALVLGLGFVAAVLVVVAVIAVVSWRVARVHTSSDTAPTRPTVAARASAGVGVAPTASIGVRMALETGGRRIHVPARSALAGTIIAVLGVVGVGVFGTSLRHLESTPGLFGFNWDARVIDPQARPSVPDQPCAVNKSRLTSVLGVGAVASVCSLNIALSGRPLVAFGITQIRGVIDPTIVEGRAPRSAREVALGAHALSALGRSIGDRVSARGAKGVTTYRIVGIAAAPRFNDQFSDPVPVDDGAFFTGSGLGALDNPTNVELVIRVVPGTNRDAVLRRVEHLRGVADFSGGPGVATAATPLEVERLQQIDSLPLVLGGFLGIVGAVSVGFVLASSVRRRSRDLAILKTLGFSRRQVSATVAWQATTIAAAGLVIGVPLGVVVGRVIWKNVADGIGVISTPDVSLFFIIGVGIVTVALANLIAALPARAAARTRPALVLRSE